MIEMEKLTHNTVTNFPTYANKVNLHNPKIIKLPKFKDVPPSPSVSKLDCESEISEIKRN